MTCPGTRQHPSYFGRACLLLAGDNIDEKLNDPRSEITEGVISSTNAKN